MLARIIYILGTIAVSIIITAGACRKKDGIPISDFFVIESKDETVATISTDPDLGFVVVSILETKVPGKAAAVASEEADESDAEKDGTPSYADYTEKDVMKEVFTVSIKDSKGGFVFPNSYGGKQSIDKMTAEIVVDSIDRREDGFASNFKVNGEIVEKFGAFTTWINYGLQAKDKTKTPQIGFVCVSMIDMTETEYLDTAATAQKLMYAEQDKAAAEEGKKAMAKSKVKFKGSEKSTCSIGSTTTKGSDFKDWAKSKDNYTSINLVFGGIEFGASTFGDVYSVAPTLFSKGLDAEAVKNIIAKFPHGFQPVKVQIVGSL